MISASETLDHARGVRPLRCTVREAVRQSISLDKRRRPYLGAAPSYHSRRTLPWHGYISDECGETARRWIVFSRAEVEAGADGPGDPESLWIAACDLAGWERQYHGPGRWFWASPGVQVGRTRVLVTQWGGLDV